MERLASMQAGCEAFERGDFFEAHEHWEDVWRVAVAPDKAHVQGLILVAAAMIKNASGRLDLCASLLRRALEKLAGAPAIIAPIDVAALRTDARQMLAQLDAGEPAMLRLRVSSPGA